MCIRDSIRTYPWTGQGIEHDRGKDANTSETQCNTGTTGRNYFVRGLRWCSAHHGIDHRVWRWVYCILIKQFNLSVIWKLSVQTRHRRRNHQIRCLCLFQLSQDKVETFVISWLKRMRCRHIEKPLKFGRVCVWSVPTVKASQTDVSV